MIKVQLSGEFEFLNNDLKKRNYEKSITTDCWMKIVINDELFFDDWVCPLELYFQYLDWKKDFDNELIRNFEYISDDNGENPILSFRAIGDKWVAFSELTKKTSDFITLNDILEFFESFEVQLLRHKNKQYK